MIQEWEDYARERWERAVAQRAYHLGRSNGRGEGYTEGFVRGVWTGSFGVAAFIAVVRLVAWLVHG